MSLSKLFGKKSKDSDDSLDLELVASDDRSVYLAFGLHWGSIVVDNGLASETKRAKKAGATHAISRMRQFGYGAIKKSAGVGDARIFPAAQVVARQHGGDAVYAVKVDAGEFWVCIIRNSAPTSVDRFILTDDESEVHREVLNYINAGRDDGVSFAVFTNFESHEFGATQLTSTDDIFLAATFDDDLLRPIASGGTLSTPTPVLLGVLIIGLAVLGQQGYRYYKKKQDAKARAAAMVDRNEPPEVAWGKAYARWEATKAAGSMDDLASVRMSVGSIPARWNGWSLKKVDCNAVAPSSASGSLTVSWSCQAAYERSSKGMINKEIAPLVPSDWKVTFIPLNKMNLSWLVSVSASPFKIADLPPKEFHFVDTVSKLQKRSTILTDDVSLAFTPSKIPPPKRDDNKPHPLPAGMPVVEEAPVTIKLPLRSLDAILDDGLPVSWNHFSLTAEDVNSGNSNLKASPLSATIKGFIYAKNK